MTVEALQAASRGETMGAERPADAQNSEVRPPGPLVQQPSGEVKAQAGPPQPAHPAQFSLTYHVDAKTKQVYFQIVDSQSGQVIRQVPPAQILALESQITQFLETANTKQPESQGGGH